VKTFVKDCKWGEFLLLRGDMISQFTDIYGEWCELEVALFRELLSADSNVIEVGSNIGLHSVPLSRFASRGKIICFEPQRILFQILCGNSARNNRTNIYPFNCAIGRSVGKKDIPCTDYDETWNYGAFSIEQGFDSESPFRGAQWIETVELTTLDDHPLAQSLDSLELLKIDAEGMETDILSGAAQTISRYRPVLFVENNNRAAGDALIKQIENLDYACYWYCTERANPRNYNRVAIKIPGGDINMVCFPDNQKPPGLDLKQASTYADVVTGNVQWIQRETRDP
jgi:FkbM family methyltransferase